MVYNDGHGNLAFHTSSPELPGGSLGMATVRFPGFRHDSVAGVTSDGSIGFAYGGSTSPSVAFTRGIGAADNSFAGPFDSDEYFEDRTRLPTAIHQGNVGRVLAVADIDGTGVPSFAVAATNEVYIVKWYATGANGQQVTQTLKLPNGLAPDSVTLAPLATGNRPSLIVTTTTAGFYVFTNDGKGNFSATPTLIQTPFRVAYETNVVDFDGDGIADVALNDIDNDRVAIFFGSAKNTGAFVSPIGDYTRLVQNADGTYSRVYNDGTVVTFNGAGFQTAIKDANGNVTDYSYNGSGQLTLIVDPTGASTSMSYAGPWIASVTDASGRTTSFQHDAAGNLTQVTDPLGNVTQYLYDANNNLIVTIPPNGGQTTNTFNSTGQVTKQTYPDGSSVLLDVSSALGLNALGVNLGGPSNAAFVPAGSRITQMQDGDGNLSEQEVNEWGAVIRVTDALGRVSTFARDGANRVMHSETPAGVSTGPAPPSSTGFAQIGSSDLLVNDYVWDANGNLLSLHEANGHAPDALTGALLDRVTSYVYEPTHNKVIQKTDAEGNVTNWSYDANGNMLAKTDAMGGVLAYTYNAQGLPLTKTDQLGNVTAYAYDASGNLTLTTDAAGTNFAKYYDASGNAILTIDAVGASVERRRSAKFDANNRTVSTTSATGQVATTAYDGNGNAIQIIDPAGNVTARGYDGLNQLPSETTPDAGTRTFSYDANGNQLTVTDASGAVTSYAYDAANRVIATTDGLGATRTLGYDLRDDAISVTDARGNVTTLGYDIYKRPDARADPDAGAYPYEYLYHYDRIDNLNGANSPSRKDGYSAGTVIGYDALSRVTNDMFSSYSYDAASNLLSASGQYSVGYAYTYDQLNRRVSATSPPPFRRPSLSPTPMTRCRGARG